MKIKIKWKPFIGLLSPPFSYPPYLPFTPLFQRPPQNQICLREAGTHYWNHCCWIFDTVIKIIIIESSPPPFLCCMYVIQWFADLTRFRILKYEYLLLFTFSSSKPVQSWEKESLIGQHFFVGPIRDWFSQFKKKKTNIRTSKFEVSSN